MLAGLTSTILGWSLIFALLTVANSVAAGGNVEVLGLIILVLLLLLLLLLLLALALVSLPLALIGGLLARSLQALVSAQASKAPQKPAPVEEASRQEQG